MVTRLMNDSSAAFFVFFLSQSVFSYFVFSLLYSEVCHRLSGDGRAPWINITEHLGANSTVEHLT